jgi:hypothetical protein
MTDIVEQINEEIKQLRQVLKNIQQARVLQGKALIDANNEIERLRAALKPFANALKGNWSHQSDEMPIDAGFGASDLRLRFRLGDFRAARDVLGNNT